MKLKTGLLLLFSLLLSNRALSAEVADVLPRDFAATMIEYQQIAEKIAEKLAKVKLDQAAAQVRSLIPATSADREFIPKLSNKEYEPAKGWSDESNKQLHVEWQDLRERFADRFYDFAKLAHDQKKVSAAWEMLRFTVWLAPEHARARTLLGFQPHESRWLRPSTISKLQKGFVDHEKFGWIPADHVKRYEAGERFWNNSWITADRDAHLHSNINTGWRIESEHFTLTTNHSLDEGVKLSRQLEMLWDVWQHVFVAYTLPINELQNRFALSEKTIASQSWAAPLALDSKKFKVVLFANRDEYNAFLKPIQANIDKTVGFYFASTRTAFFFAGKDQDPGTIFHEATHQLFQESQATSKDAGSKNNFWLIEAVACYMETLEPAENAQGFFLGGKDKVRMQAARHRFIKDQFYISLAELSAKGMADLQRDPNLPKIYSQSAGLMQFFMNSNDGRYREPLIRFFSTIYANKSTPYQLSKILKRPFVELDKEYYEYIRKFGPVE